MKIKDKKIILLFIVFLVITFTYPGCRGKQGENIITLRWSFFDDPTGLVIKKSLAKAYEETHPKVKIVIENVSGGVYETKILTEFASRTAPDILIIGSIVAPFLKKGVLLELTPYLTRDEVDLSDFYLITLKPFQYHDGIYGLPVYHGPTILYYNKRLFDQAKVSYPDQTWRWEDLLAAAKKLTVDINRDGKVDQWGVLPTYWQEFIQQNNGSVFNKDGTKCLLGQPEAIEAIQFVADLYNRYKVAPNLYTRRELGDIQLFVTDKLAMFQAGYWLTDIFRKTKELTWDIAPMPKGKKRSVNTGVFGYSISTQTKHPEEAWEFLRYLVSKETQIVEAKSANAVPSRKSIANSPVFLQPHLPPEHNKFVLEAADYTEVFLYEFEPITVINSELESVWMGKKEAEKVCKELVPRVNKLLEESH